MRHQRTLPGQDPEGPQTDHGTTTIEENVVAKIGMAARQVPGVTVWQRRTPCFQRRDRPHPHYT